MNKAELIDHIAKDLETTKVEAAKFVDSFMGAVYSNLRKDGVKLAGFGTFSAKKRAARKGRNPQTGEELKIAAKWAPAFKAGSELKEAAAKK